jgi:hypothetical protein
LIANPIRKVLSTIQAQRVRALLMGGQACVLYGAAQFSRDVDLAVLADAANLQRLRAALDELEAENIAVPPFSAQYLERGHAIHFRCRHPAAAGLRVDVMAKMRGVADFETLWSRRTEIADPQDFTWQLLSLPDLVQAKKTQRDKDWQMLRALLEADYFARRATANAATIEFWLRELRTPGLLVELARSQSATAERLAIERSLLRTALAGDLDGLRHQLAEEETRECETDKAYWRPLKAELEKLRHDRLG